MLEVDQALETILSHTKPLNATVTPLMSSSMGQVIVEDLRADLDSPPFAKALMDGYAIRTVDLVDGHGAFEIIEQVAAGAMPKKALSRGQATRIFTGAALPEGADAVIKQELATNDACGGGGLAYGHGHQPGSVWYLCHARQDGNLRDSPGDGRHRRHRG
jgi:molybdopterin molybdotransferase